MRYTVTMVRFDNGAQVGRGYFLGEYPTLAEAQAAGERDRARAKNPNALEVQVNDPDGNIIPPAHRL